MSDKKTELKPCPFCGGEARACLGYLIEEYEDDYCQKSTLWFAASVGCPECDCEIVKKEKHTKIIRTVGTIKSNRMLSKHGTGGPKMNDTTLKKKRRPTMPEYIGGKPKAVAPGEPVLIDNRCESPVEVGAGLIFREDGDYAVSVHNGRIAVCKIGGFEKPNDIPSEIIEAAERNEKRIMEKVDQFYDELIAEKQAEIERLKEEIAKMPPLDYEKLAENPPEPPKEEDDENHA